MAKGKIKHLLNLKAIKASLGETSLAFKDLKKKVTFLHKINF
jgi:hypothetical protein